jgi:hypothetical protein
VEGLVGACGVAGGVEALSRPRMTASTTVANSGRPRLRMPSSSGASQSVVAVRRKPGQSGSFIFRNTQASCAGDRRSRYVRACRSRAARDSPSLGLGGRGQSTNARPFRCIDSSENAWLSHAPGMIRTCGLCLRTTRLSLRRTAFFSSPSSLWCSSETSPRCSGNEGSSPVAPVENILRTLFYSGCSARRAIGSRVIPRISRARMALPASAGTLRAWVHMLHRASVGDIRAARMAGSRPAMVPIARAEARPPAQARGGMTVAQCWVWA